MQVSPLGPFLFIIYIHDFIKSLIVPVQLTCAEDTLILSSGNTTVDAAMGSSRMCLE